MTVFGDASANACPPGAQEVEAEPHGGQGAQGATADAAGSSQFTSAKKQRQDSSPDASSGPPATSTHAGHGGASSEARDAGAPAPSAETIATSDVPRRSSAPTGAYAVLMAAGRARQGRASTAPKPPSQGESRQAHLPTARALAQLSFTNLAPARPQMPRCSRKEGRGS